MKDNRTAMDPEVDVVAQRKKRNAMRGVRRFSVFILLAIFCAYLYVQRDAWIPKLAGIGSRYQSITQNDGTLAEGNFPLTISGKSDYQAEIANDVLFIQNDAYLYLYSPHGDLKDVRQHMFSNAVLKTSGAYALVYENDGSGFRVDKPSKNMFVKYLDNDIIFGVINDSGYTAIVTESDQYACSLQVFDETGKAIYTRNCVNRLIDVTFQNDGNGCAFMELDVENGELVSRMKSVRFDEKDVQWESEPLSTMGLELSYSESGMLCVVGDTMCAYYDDSGNLSSSYTYMGDLVAYDVAYGSAAVILKDENQREARLILMDRSADSPSEVRISDTSKKVLLSQDDAYVMNADSITSYAFSGKSIATVKLDVSYRTFVKQDGYIFLMGYDQINRVDFKE